MCIGLLYSCNNVLKPLKHNTYQNMQPSQVTIQKNTRAYEEQSSENMRKNESIRFLYMQSPSRTILNEFAKALPVHVQQQAAELRQRMLPVGGGILISVHVGMHADHKDGDMIHEAYRPHLLCAKATQAHFDKQGVTSAVFLHSDSTRVKNEAHSLGIKYLTTLDTPAEYGDREHTILAWLLLGAGNVVLGAHNSSFSKTAAQRTGAFLYQLPVDASAMHADIRRTVLVPEPCVDFFQGCPVFALGHALIS